MNEAREQGERLADAMIEVISQARWEAKIKSVRELARRAGMSHTALNSRLHGVAKFDTRDIGSLGLVLGLTPVELIERAQAIVAEKSGWSTGEAIPTGFVLDESHPAEDF